jgi:protein-S-isoprenylcysteine O-methyltransferase Ste14
MNNTSQIIEITAFSIVMLCWFGFAAAFVFRSRPPKTEDRKRDPASILGIIAQVFSFAIVWSTRRPFFSPFVNLGIASEFLLAVLAITFAVCSVWMVLMAVKVLGKEWSLTARLIEDHKLATEGPYQLSRNPIYTGMLGMLIATGLVFSYWTAVLIALVIFMIGTCIRVRSEEALLAEAFGPAYEIYRKRVPALIPGLF